MELSMTQKVVAGCITALLMWTAYTTQDMSKQVAILDTKLTAATEDRYRAADAARDFALRDDRINNIAERMTDVEKRSR